ncbi:hypothetical protein L5G32_18320 [Gordonia sp. HY002]|uniref:hypothetical protein n=1 Tax=Gordonia zhenghanii TaxID=2911516 RepID=UPI001EF0F914|nr:hypothetical protein [Gordonia zhenghanii]MCF8572219.1 hypothetical protein [Gordonia zhenghanii]MCF8606130.1 hypothetical protein [Gordonia zhenghanii]
MSGGQCWSSIVATPDERAALGLGADGEWLVGCVLREGHPGAHASDGAQAHRGRRRWLVWGDFARGAQMLRDEDPCPMVELDGAPCLYYLGHSGPHRYPGITESAVSGDAPSPLDRRPPQVDPGPSAEQAQRGFPPTQPWSAPTAFDLDPEPTTDRFPALPKPAGWPNRAPETSSEFRSEWSSDVGVSAMDRLFAELPSLAPQDAPAVSSRSDVWTIPDVQSHVDHPVSPDTQAPPVPMPDLPILDVDADHVEFADLDAPDVSALAGELPTDELPVVEAPVVEIPVVEIPVVEVPVVEVPVAEIPVAEAPVVEGFVASHDTPAFEDADLAPVSSGPTRFEPADHVEGSDGSPRQHQPVAVVNEYEPSLGEDTPGGATTVVYRDDPNASSMEVRPTSNDVLTTSILQVIASNGDPVRIGVPTTLRPISGPARTADPANEHVSGDDVKAMTEAVRDAADRLRANPGADDTYAISEALRDMASSLGRLADRFGK